LPLSGAERVVVDDAPLDGLAVFAERRRRQHQRPCLAAMMLKTAPGRRFDVVRFVEEDVAELAGELAGFVVAGLSNRSHRGDDNVAAFNGFKD